MIIDLPNNVVITLLSIALQTEQGKLFFAGYRMGSSELNNLEEAVKIMSASAKVLIDKENKDVDAKIS
jgi:hypothetical protein